MGMKVYGYDYLADLSPVKVAAWYGRLATYIGGFKVTDKGGAKLTPLSSILLQHYLDNRSPTSEFRFAPPLYLQQAPEVLAVTELHRKILLSLAPMPPGNRIAGVVPRLRGDPGFSKINLAVGSIVPLHLNTDVTIPDGIVALVTLQFKIEALQDTSASAGLDTTADLATSLHGFQLVSVVNLQCSAVDPVKRSAKFRFVTWMSYVTDRYDWDYDKHLTLPNPDFNSKIADAVRPQDKKLNVYHSNAKRIEDAKLAAPYDIVSEAWSVGGMNDADVSW